MLSKEQQGKDLPSAEVLNQQVILANVQQVTIKCYWVVFKSLNIMNDRFSDDELRVHKQLLAKLYQRKQKNENYFTLMSFEIPNLYIFSQKLRVEQLDEEPESEGAAAAANETREFLNAINNSIEAGNGRMEDKYVIAFLRNKLKSMPCQNQGFILDGYPKTIAQARELFASEYLFSQMHLSLISSDRAEQNSEIYNSFRFLFFFAVIKQQIFFH